MSSGKAGLKIGIAQVNPVVGDFKGNLLKIKKQISEADKKGLDLVVFSELVVSGYPVWDLANKPSFIEAGLKSIEAIKKYSQKKKVAVIVGFVDNGPRVQKSYNALAVIYKGKIIHKQYKILLPNYDVFLEQIFFETGVEQQCFCFKGVKIATSICEDIWDDLYPVKPIEQIKKSGAQLLINISASPYHAGAPKIRHDLISKKSKRYGIAMVYANQVGGQDELIFDGRSMAADEYGNVFHFAPAFLEGVSVFEWKPKERRVKVFRFDDEKVVGDIYKSLVVGLRDYVRKNNFSKVVIGLSGGIDSALVAAIAHDAVGSEAILGVALPGPYSSIGSVQDAKALAQNLNIELRKISIKSVYELFLKNKKITKKLTLAEENLQARLRGLELMYLSNKEGRLLLTTGNKSEMAMGYSTLYGDMCGGLGVIGDVYKTLVYKLACYRNRVFPVIPESSIQKPPSAELRPNQKDEDSLPPYDILDEVLYYYIEKNQCPDMIKKKFKGKISGSLISQVIRSVDHNEYKRRQAPPVLKVTEKAWFGRRMPITNMFQKI